MGELFKGFFCLEKPTNISSISAHTLKITILFERYVGLKDMYVRTIIQMILKVNFAKNERTLKFYVTMSFL